MRKCLGWRKKFSPGNLDRSQRSARSISVLAIWKRKRHQTETLRGLKYARRNSRRRLNLSRLSPPNRPRYRFTRPPLGDPDIVFKLEPQPGLRGYVKVEPQPQRRVGRDCSLPVNNTVNPGRRHIETSRESIHADPERLHEILEQDLAWVDRG